MKIKGCETMTKQIYITVCTDIECRGMCRPSTPRKKRTTAHDIESNAPTEKQISEKEACEIRIREEVCGFCGSKLKLGTIDE